MNRLHRYCRSAFLLLVVALLCHIHPIVSASPESNTALIRLPSSKTTRMTGTIDTFHAWNGLLRYGEWRRAAQLAQQYNRGVFKTMEKTYVPSEYYHQSGTAIGCPGMSSVASMPLFFQRYIRDYRAGRAVAEWTRFAPPPLP